MALDWATAACLEVRTIVAPGGKADRQLVLLHGWGANYDDLAGLAPFFTPQGWSVYCPNGLMPHPMGGSARMWYDLQDSDWTGLGTSRDHLYQALVTLPDCTGVSLDRTVLAGFSQGAAMTLDLGLRLPLAGLILWSGYLHPELTDLEFESPGRSPLFICHGQFDPVVPIAAARELRAFGQKLGLSVQYQEFEGGHEIPPVAIQSAQTFLSALSEGW